MAFAENTVVPVSKTKIELDALLAKHGAKQRGFVDDDAEGRAVVIFALKERQYRLEVPLPKFADFKKKPGSYYSRTETQQQQAFEQACRTRWRAILLLVKAKLETIAIGVSTPEREFLADLVLPGGQTMMRLYAERIESAIADGGPMPPLLGTGGAP